MNRALAWILLLAVASTVAAEPGAEAAFEPEAGSVATLPPVSDHWLWAPDRLLQHTFLFDGDTGEALATISSPGLLTPKVPLVSRTRGEVYSVDVDYARGVRGARTDYVTIYDIQTLDVRGEIVLTHHTAASNASLGYVALLDGDRFLVVFSGFPSASASVIDLETRSIASEVQLAGCAGVFAIGDTRFASVCGDGTVLSVILDPDGHLQKTVPSEPFFDSVDDPVFLMNARHASSRIFVSFAGDVHEVDFQEEAPRPRPAWSLTSEEERRAGWRPGGLQHLAIHEPTGRLFVVMHEGGSGSHKDAGPEIWQYDLRERVLAERWVVPNLDAAFLANIMELGADSFVRRILGMLIPSSGAHTIAVSQDEHPLLFARSAELGVVAVFDAETGRHLRNLEQVGFFGPTLGVP